MNLPDDARDVVPSLGWKDPLEEKMATHPGFLPRTSRGQRSLAGDSSRGHKEQDTAEGQSTHTREHATRVIRTHTVLPSPCQERK